MSEPPPVSTARTVFGRGSSSETSRIGDILRKETVGGALLLLATVTALVWVNSPFAGYWHDFGHIQIKENLGFLNHEEWLRMIGPRAFGCHLQDVIWPGQDHQPPFAGHVDLDKLIPLLPPTCLFVWEMSPRKTADEIRRSVEIWKQRYGG